jgi:hypothetical protein
MSDYIVTLLVERIASVTQAELGELFQLKAGEKVDLVTPALSIQFVDVLSDSRCPKSVQCTWSGEAIILLEIQFADEAPVQIELSSHLIDQNSAEVGDYLLEFRMLDPYPKTPEDEILIDEYVATFLVITR